MTQREIKEGEYSFFQQPPRRHRSPQCIILQVGGDEMTNSPQLLEIALYYHYSPRNGADYDRADGREGNGVITSCCETLVKAGLLTKAQGASAVKRTYHPTDGLEVYVAALGDVPFPKLKWVREPTLPARTR